MTIDGVQTQIHVHGKPCRSNCQANVANGVLLKGPAPQANHQLDQHQLVTCYNSTRNEQAYTSCKYEQVSNKLTIFINRTGQGTENYAHKYGVNSTLLHNVDVACRSLHCSTGNPL